MAGVVRLVFGILFLLAGIFLLVTVIFLLVGVLFLIIGIILIASGASAREDTQRIVNQQQQTNMLLQQQIQMNAALAARQSHYVEPQYGPPGTQPAALAERYCPACGAGNARVSAFCARCGRPLPPPP